MVRAFVLVDTLPGREKDVFNSLGKVPSVILKRMLKEKVGNAEIIVLLETPDPDGVDKILTGQVRGISGVHTVRKVQTHHTLVGPILKVMDEMEREAPKPR